MSRRKKLPHGRRKPPQRPSTKADRNERLIADTVATFTCATEITHDFLHQCVDELESLDCQIDYNELAIEMWGGRPGHAADLVAALSDYLATRQRHRAVLTTLRQRLTDLIAIPNHEHLDPAQWRDAVSKRVLSVPVTT